MNGGGKGGGGGGTLRLEVGGNDPVLGDSFGSISGRSRAMHKSQGFGGGGFGGGGGGGAKSESFQLLDGKPANKDIFEGIDTTWARVPGGAEIGQMADKAIADFNAKDPAASVPALLAIRTKVAALAKDPLVQDKSRQLDRILQACLGLEVDTVVPKAEVVPGETLRLKHTVKVSSGVPVSWMGVRYPSIERGLKDVKMLKANEATTWESTQTVPASTPLSQPYWLREEHSEGMFRVKDPTLIGRPENPPAFPVELIFEVGGQTLVIPGEPVQIVATKVKEAQRRRLDVIAPVALSFVSDVQLFAPGATRQVPVKVTAYRPGAAGTLQLDAPSGWKVTPATQSFSLKNEGDSAGFTFAVSAPDQPAKVGLTASVLIDGARFSSQRIEIRYDHIPPQLLQPTARLKAVSMQLATRGKKIGYLPGAGDSVAECLKQMGYEVTLITGADLTVDKLRGFDAVVIGVRAFNVRKDIAGKTPALFAYVKQGGTVVAQYNRQFQLDAPTSLGLTISADRVTDKDSVMTFLAPDHPAMTGPNKITAADFEGWVQERGIYFPSKWDKGFTPLLACADPNAPQMKGSLLVAHYGDGYFVYTGLSFFRQLPAGVPGAYRVFANLVSLGRK